MCRGRPTRYLPDIHPAWAQSLSRRGLDEPQIAAELHINPATLTRWKKRYPDFCAALKEGKGPADGQVEKSLFRRALGYDFEEKKATYEDGVLVKEEVTKKHLAPDVTAQIFWLKNRRPDLWRDKREHEIAGKDGKPIQHQAVPLDLSGLTDEELLSLETIAAKLAGSCPGEPAGSGGEHEGREAEEGA